MPSKQPSFVDESNENEFLGEPIEHPHRHDVLSGRGNFVNHHPGNEYFRNLVKMHKVSYVATPKSQKPKFSRMIYEAIRAQDPPGRFLKQDETTKLWYEISDKKAVDKTRQALREGAPEIKEKIVVSAATAAVDGGGGCIGITTNPDPDGRGTMANIPMVMSQSSTNESDAQLEEIQKQIQELQELKMQLQRQQDIASNNNRDLLMNQQQQQLMASTNTWNDIHALLMEQSFLSSNNSAAMINAYLSSSSSILGGMGNNISISDFALGSNLSLLGQSTNTLGSPWSSGLLSTNAFANSGSLSNSSGSMSQSTNSTVNNAAHQLGQNRNNLMVHSNNFLPVPQLAPTTTTPSSVVNPVLTHRQPQQQQYPLFTLDQIMGEQLKQQKRQQLNFTMNNNLMPPPQPQIISAESNVAPHPNGHEPMQQYKQNTASIQMESHINSDNQASGPVKSILKNGALSRDTRIEGLSREGSLKMNLAKESNSVRLTRMGGLPREESLRLGDILVGETMNMRRIPSGSCMSFSMGDVDSTLSKMLEDSLDLDVAGPSQAHGTNLSGSHNTSANSNIENSASSSNNNPSFTSFTSAHGSSHSSNLSIMEAAAVAVAAAYHRPRTINNNTLSLSTTCAPSDDNNAYPCGSMKTEGSLSFLELLDFDEQYEASFRLEDADDSR